MDRGLYRVFMRYCVIAFVAFVLLLLLATIDEMNQPERITVPAVTPLQLEEPGTSATTHR